MSLVPRFVYGDLDLTDYPFSVEFGSDFGNPENVVDVVASLLADGEVLEVNRRTNRLLTIPVLIDDADMQALAEAEAALIVEAGKARNTLSIDPGDGVGVTTVFETFQAQPRWIRNDDEELNGVRRMLLEIPALPHARSVDKITDDAGTAPDAPGTVVYAAESTTGWATYASYPATTPAVDSAIFVEGTGSVRIPAQLAGEGVSSWSGQDFTFGRHFDQITGLSISTSTGGYLGVSIYTDFTETMYDNYGQALPSGLDRLYLQFSGSAAWVERSFTIAEVESGFVRYVLPIDAGLTVTGYRFYVAQYRYGHGHGVPNVRYDNFTLSTAATTDSQILKTFDVEGSARAVGSIHIAAPDDSAALGNVFVMTVPTDDLEPGFRPDVRRWVVSGSAVVDATALYGSHYIANDPVFEVPVATLRPGSSAIVALCRSGADPLEIGVTAQLVAGGAAVGPVSSASISVPMTADEWRLLTLGTLYLPPLPMQNADSADVVRIEFTGGAKLADAYMVPQSADFSIVDCGTGTVSASGASSHLWIDSADPVQTTGGWWRGPEVGRGSARSAWPDVKKRGRHLFAPGRMNAYVVTTEAQGPTIELEYFPRWFGNAAR